MLNREACTSTPVARDRAADVAVTIARFIDACATDQIQLAPDKCMSVFFSASFRLKFSELFCVTEFKHSHLILQLYLFVKDLEIRPCCLKNLCEEWLQC